MYKHILTVTLSLLASVCTAVGPFDNPYASSAFASYRATATGGSGGSAATSTGSSSSSTSTSAASQYIGTKAVGSSVAFGVNIPSSGSTDLFFQITGPTSMSWIGLGQGSSMSGSNMFIIYANAAGTNVTLSNRLGTGEVQPTTAGAAKLTLLAGSGISNGVMTANVLCANCQSWSGGSMSYTATSTSWIWAYLSGSSLASDSTSATIGEHSAYGTLSFNLATSTGGDSTDPFIGISAASTTSNGGSTGGNGADSGVSVSIDMSPKIVQAHAIIASVAFVALFPIGVIVLRAFSFTGAIWVHAAIQVIAYILAIAVLASGIFIAKNQNAMMAAHPIIGIIVIVVLFLQPALGIVHHLNYKRTGQRGLFSFSHVWIGRIFVTLGIINGFLGLNLARAEESSKIGYGVAAGIMWALWITSLCLWGRRESKTKDGRRFSQRSQGSRRGNRLSRNGSGERELVSEEMEQRNVYYQH